MKTWCFFVGCPVEIEQRVEVVRVRVQGGWGVRIRRCVRLVRVRQGGRRRVRFRSENRG